jgi:hypothetical protein
MLDSVCLSRITAPAEAASAVPEQHYRQDMSAMLLNFTRQGVCRSHDTFWCLPMVQARLSQVHCKLHRCTQLHGTSNPNDAQELAGPSENAQISSVDAHNINRYVILQNSERHKCIFSMLGTESHTATAGIFLTNIQHQGHSCRTSRRPYCSSKFLLVLSCAAKAL